MAAAAAAAEDPDPVVAEVDLHLTKKHAESLYVFQYPLCPSTHVPYDMKHGTLACRIRPGQKRVEMDLPMDTRSSTYDQVKAEELAQRSLGDSPSEAAIAASQFPTGRMDKYTLRSSAVDIGTHYCVAAIDGSGVHLTPLSRIVQLRPSFHYLDTREPVADTATDAAADDEEEEAVTVKVQTLRERRAAARLAAQAEPDEPWVAVEVLARNCPQARELRDELVECSGEGGAAAADFTTTKEDFVEALRAAATDKSTASKAPEVSLSQLRQPSMPLDQRVRKIMLGAQVVTTQTVSELCGAPEDDVLLVLQDIAVLVHGLWVIKSDVLYPDGYKSPETAAPAEALRSARDFILYQLHARPNTRPSRAAVWRERPGAHSRPQEHFRGVDASAVYADDIATHYDVDGRAPAGRTTDTGYLKRSDVARFLGADTKVGAEDIREMLKGVAVQVMSQGWAFRYDTDVDFVSRHTRIVERQAELWRLRHASLVNAPSHTRRISISQSQQQQPAAVAVAGGAAVAPDAMALIKAHFAEKGVVTLTALRQFCQQHSIGWAEMEAALKEIAAEVIVEWYKDDKVYVMAQDDPVRQIILSMFCTSRTIKRKDAMEECKRLTGQEPTTTTWNRIISGLADRKGAAWEFRLP